MLDSILAHLRTSVPFADHVGIELDTIDPGRAIARLPERLDSTNHIGSVHAGALFTLAEAASGAAMAGFGLGGALSFLYSHLLYRQEHELHFHPCLQNVDRR